MQKIKILTPITAMLLLVGYGDDSSYNCNSDDASLTAIRIQSYDDMYNKFDPRLDKILDDSLSTIKIQKREILNIDDNAKRSTCKVTYIMDNPKNEKEFENMARVILVMERIIQTNGMILNAKNNSEIKDKFFQEIERNLKLRKDELAKSINENPSSQEVVVYDMYDNGRGESFIEVEDR
ncbi:hypothetical protein [Campylobacter sp.]|uniref:hypothetical protein n=1 Tax=Campylobacter sp. TaxID=205 RepID=UPI0026FF637E|nr:hypothetical protein [Campylobacter sp.]